jgi:hypothetical protein
MLQTMTPEEIQARIDEYTAALARGAAIDQDLADSYRDASVGLKGFSRQLRSSQALLTTSLGGLVKSVSEGNTSATIYNDAIGAAAKVTATYAQQVPVLGKALSVTITAFGAVAKSLTAQADQEFALFQDLSRSGLANGMDDAFKNLQKAGYTMKEIGEFGSLMKQNSTVLATMGGTAQEGLTKFTKIAKEINQSQLGTGLMRMGNKMPDITNGIANYIKFQQMGGQSISKDEKEVAKNANEFMIEQDKLTKLTGLSAEEQNKIHQEALGSQQYAAMEFGLQKEAREHAGTARGKEAERKLLFNKQMLGVIQAKGGTKVRKDAELYIAKALNTDGARRFERGYGQLAEFMAAGGTDIADAANLFAQDAATTLEQAGELARSGNFEKNLGSLAEMARVASTSNTDMAQAVEDAKQAIQDQIDGKDKPTAKMVAFNQNERDSALSAAALYHATMGVTTSALEYFSIVTRNVANIFGKLAGKEGNMGGKEARGGIGGVLATTAAGAGVGAGAGALVGGIGAIPGALIGAILGLGTGIMGLFADGGYTGDGGKYEPAGIVHKGEYVLDATTTKNLGLNKSITGYSSGGYTGDGGKYEPAGIVHKGEYVIDASTTKDLGLNKTISTGTGYADGGKVNDPKVKSTAGVQPQNNSAEIKKLNSTINANYQSVMNRIDQLAQKVSSIQAVSNKPSIKTGTDNSKNLTGSTESFQSILSTLDKKIATFFGINSTPTTTPVENNKKLNKSNVDISTNEANFDAGAVNSQGYAQFARAIADMPIKKAKPDTAIADTPTKKSDTLLDQYLSTMGSIYDKMSDFVGTKPNKVEANTPIKKSDTLLDQYLSTMGSIYDKMSDFVSEKPTKSIADTPTKKSDTVQNQYQSILDSVNQRMAAFGRTSNKISSPAPTNTSTTIAEGITSPTTPEQSQTEKPLSNTPEISGKPEQSGFEEMKRLISGIGSYQGILDISSKQIKSSKGNSNTVFDSYNTILSEQKTDSEQFANKLNSAIDPVIKNFSSLTLTTKQLTGLLDELPIEGGENKEGDTGGIIGQAKSLISSTFEKIKQSLGLSSGSKMVSGTGDMYQFGAASSGGSAGGGAEEKPKDTTTEAVPSGSPPSPGAGGGGGTGKEEGVKPDILSKKTALESAIGKKITVTSGFRAGAPNHGDGSAIDLGFGANNFGGEAERAKLYTKALDLGFNGIGAEYKAAGGAHIHLDTTHPGLMGWGSNGTWSELKNESPFLEQLITARRAGKPGPTPPSAATGGVIAGPTSGYEATLHGTEAVVPLPDGRTIPVQTKNGGNSNGAQEQISLLTQELSKLDSLLSIMAKQNDITDRMLKNQG